MQVSHACFRIKRQLAATFILEALQSAQKVRSLPESPKLVCEHKITIFMRVVSPGSLFLSHNYDDYSYSTLRRASHKVLHKDDKDIIRLTKDETKTNTSQNADAKSEAKAHLNRWVFSCFLKESTETADLEVQWKSIPQCGSRNFKSTVTFCLQPTERGSQTARAGME